MDKFAVLVAMLGAATITQISADTLYVSLGLVFTILAGVFWIGGKLKEIDVTNKITDERLHRIEKQLEKLPCNNDRKCNT